MSNLHPLVGIVMGSESDLSIMEEVSKILSEFGVSSETNILSAHRTPDLAEEYSKTAQKRGIKVIIAGAGMANHLAGAMAAHSVLPVIGVPLEGSSLHGLDALLSTVQMPPGIPVACVAIGKAGAQNAAYLALQILALSDNGLWVRLVKSRKETEGALIKKNEELREKKSEGK